MNPVRLNGFPANPRTFLWPSRNPRARRGTVDYSDARTWLIFFHVLGVLLFMLSHGASAAVGFRLRKEQNPERLRALLELSASSYRGLSISFFWILITGAILGAKYDWWLRTWFWASIVLLFVVSGVMTPLVAIPYNKVRRALGLKPPFGREPKKVRETPPPTVEEIPALLAKAKPVAAAVIGMGGIVVILFLMIWKPF